MSHNRRKMKPKDVSAPIKVEHVSHVGQEDVHVENGSITATPPTPCGGTESHLATQTIISSFLSSDFRQTLRELIREEIAKAFVEERPKLLSEIERLQYVPSPCQTDRITDGASKQELKEHKAGEFESSKDACWELVNAEPTSNDILQDAVVVGSGRKTVLQAQRQFSDPLPVPAPRPSVTKDLQWSFPGDNTKTLKVYQPRKAVSKPRATRRVSKDDERECLAQALQANIIPLVDRLLFNYSDIPEQLISAGHITEDECRLIRDDFTRKDQVRYLVSRTKSRDLADMKRFLELLEKETPDVVAMINKTFEENKKINVKCTTCALCLCSSNIDIKDIIDVLWSSRAIPDGFYNEMIACTKSLGSQKQQWKTLVDILNSKHNKKKIAYETLFNSILSRGNFDFIVRPLRVMLEKEGRLDCHCHSPVMMTSLQMSIGSTSTSSHSPMTTPSESQLSVPSETEYMEDNMDTTYRLKMSRFERKSFIDQKSGENRDYQPASLDSILDTISEDNNKLDSNRHGYVNQTVEFHRPIQGSDDFKEYIETAK